MNKVPTEIDTLIWSVAESGDQTAAKQFEQRFPQYAGELHRRIATIRDLKKAKGAVAAGVVPSTFRPLPRLPEAKPFRWQWPAGIVGLGITAIAAFTISKSATTERGTDGPSGPPLETRLRSKGRGYRADDDEQVRIPQRASSTPPVVTPAPVVQLPKQTQKPITLHIERASLHTILEGVAAAANLQVTIAPGTPDPEVRVDYDNVAPTDILLDMGKRFGFTPFEQGPNQVLIVPAVEGNGPTNVDPPAPKPNPDALDIGKVDPENSIH